MAQRYTTSARTSVTIITRIVASDFADKKEPRPLPSPLSIPTSFNQNFCISSPLSFWTRMLWLTPGVCRPKLTRYRHPAAPILCRLDHVNPGTALLSTETLQSLKTAKSLWPRPSLGDNVGQNFLPVRTRETVAGDHFDEHQQQLHPVNSII